MAMQITHPKRILILTPKELSPQPIINALTDTTSDSKSKSKPKPKSDSAPGSDPSDPPIHHISNAYYSAAIPVWTDQVLDPDAWAQQWKAEEGAADVIRAVGAWIVGFEKPVGRDAAAQMAALKSTLTNITSVLTHHASSSSISSSSYDLSSDTDAVLIALAIPSTTIHNTSTSATTTSDPDLDLDLDDLCREAGNWEYIDGTLPYTPTTSTSTSATSHPPLNEFGETSGIARLLEALQGGEWDALDGTDADGFDELEEELEDADAKFMGDVADGFGELLAAGKDAREERLLGPESAARDTQDEAKAGDREAGIDGGERDEEDETWKVRGRDLNVEKGLQGLWGPDAAADWATDEDVEELQKMMLRLQAAKDLGADLSMVERRKVAAKAVREVMRDFH